MEMTGPWYAGERAQGRRPLTAAAGVLMLAVAFVMMVVAAPGHGARPGVPGQAPPLCGLTTDVCHQLTSRG